MTVAAWVLVGVAGVTAASDWIAVVQRWKRLEYLAKPLTVIVLIGVAMALHSAVHGRRGWVVVALLLSLAGDVFLMLPRDLFVAGLGSFLLAHVAYVVAFTRHGGSATALVESAVVVVVAAILVGRPVILGVRRADPAMVGPVVAYIVVLGAMVTTAIATTTALLAVGGILFMASDSLIAWNRFVRERPWAPLAIIVTYHLAQAALVTGLVSRS